MPRIFHTTDITGHCVFLGTGTSVGVPMIGCGCPICTSSDPRNRRTRSSIMIGLPQGNLLIDTAPDLRSQLLREKIGVTHAVLFTHEHTDHVFGLDELRMQQFTLKGPVPLYCEEVVEERIREAFRYAFLKREDTHAGSTPRLEFHRISTEPFEALGTPVTPVRLLHGPYFDVLGFRFGNMAYCTDVSEIPEESMALLQDLDLLVLGALRPSPHPTHLSIDQAVSLSRKLAPRRTLLTHLGHEVDYARLLDELPNNIQPAYDGLHVDISGMI